MRTFDQASAKAYFIDLIVRQAEQDGVALSEAEKYELAFTETGPAFVLNPKLEARFEEETTMEAYERKIVKLVQGAYRNAATSPEGKQTFKAAYKALKQGDHYLLIMLRAGLGLRLQAWWPL